MNTIHPNARPSNTEQARFEISNLRRDTAKESLQAFTEIYLKRLLPTPYSVMHEEIFKLLDEASVKRSVKLAIAAPHGYGTSALISFAYVLWSLCYQREPFIVLFARTAKQAGDYLAQIKTQLQKNPLFLQDFPEACHVSDSGREPEVWRKDEIVLFNRTRVLALKAKEQIRSDQRSENHPTLIVCDGIESNHPSSDESEQLFRWATGLISHPDMAETNLIVTGVIRAEHSMLERLAYSEICVGWEGRRYSPIIHWAKHKELWFQWERIYYGKEEYQGRSGPGTAKQFFLSHETMMLEGVQVLWSACEEYYWLMEQLLTLGALRFFNEKLHRYHEHFDAPLVTLNLDNEPREQDGVIPDAYRCLADRKENKPTRRIPIIERIELILD
jgi:hypothetical protein